MRLLARAMVHTFFRRVDVDGVELLPSTGPVIVVANHANGLVDGLLLMSTLPRWPRFLGKATLFKTPLKPFLRLAGVIPVYRVKDSSGGKGPAEPDRAALNDATFAACRRLLATGAMVALFPEGISHDHNTLQPLKTGAARIALGAAFQEGAANLDIVPVGLAYDAKATFRSHAVVTIGDPIPVDQWKDDYTRDERGAVRACTDAITDGLSAVSPDHSTVTAPHAVTRRLRFTGTVRAAKAATPQPAMLVAAPVALVGAAIHAAPYQLVKRLATLPKGDSIRSTVKLLGSTVLFALEWTGLAVWAWRRRGPLAAAVTLVACPLSGYIAVRFAESLRETQ